MKPNEKKEIIDLLNSLQEEAEKTDDIELKERILAILKVKREKIGDQVSLIEDALLSEEKEDSEYTFDDYSDMNELFEHVKEIEWSIEKNIETQQKKEKHGGRLTFVGNFFKRFRKEKNNDEFFDDSEYEDEEPMTLKTHLIRTGIVLGTVAVIGGIVGGTALYNNYQEKRKEKERLEQQQKELEESYKQSLEKLKELEEIQKQNALGQQEENQKAKEEKIVELAQQLAEEFNKYDGINVTFEQTLALFIHLNVGNSFALENEYSLDAITRQNLIKQYYVGLTKETEEFASYTITDADLSRLSAEVFNIRNAVVNRVIVLNDEGNYSESRELIAIFKKFVTEDALQDEVDEFTTSIQNMQTSDRKQLKEEMYRYYNYLFAGPKSEVRNFDDYGHYIDGDNKEMTFENQGTTMRFYTWFMDAFASINLSTDLIPQDIINSAQAKLMDQATLLRMLGFKNCNSFNAYYGIDFDNAIDNRIKSNTKKYGYTKATGKSQLDSEIHEGLLNNSEVGSSFTIGGGSTVTIVESGERTTTVVVEPDPGSAREEDSTPSGPSEREETEGGGGEEKEEIAFPEDPTEEIIEEGGEVIEEGGETIEEGNEPEEKIEEISFKTDETSVTASIRDEINALLMMKQTIQNEEIVPGCMVYIEEEKGFEKTYKC